MLLDEENLVESRCAGARTRLSTVQLCGTFAEQPAAPLLDREIVWPELPLNSSNRLEPLFT